MTILKDLCTLIVDCEHKTAPTQDTGYPSIRTPNIGRGRLLLGGVNRVSEETYRLWTQREVPQQGDLVLAREAPIGNVAIIPPGLKVCLGQRTVLIRPNEQKINAQYLTYLLLGDEIQGRIQSMSNGATVHHLNMSDIRNLEVPPLPSPKVQDQIASILSAYDDLVENNTRRIGILEEMAQMIYREWFVNFRFPGHEIVEMVESEMGLIPRGWMVEPLREVATLISRGISPQYDDDARGIVINQKCIRDGRLSLEHSRRQSKKISEDKLIRLGDVLINSTGVGTLGRVAQVLEPISDCTVDSHVSIVRSKLNSEFFGRTLLQLEEHFERLGVGSTGQTELSRERIGSTTVIVPTAEWQERFSQVVAPINKMTVCCLARNSNLRQTRNLLLPRLVSGEVSVQQVEAEAVAQGV